MPDVLLERCATFIGQAQKRPEEAAKLTKHLRQLGVALWQAAADRRLCDSVTPFGRSLMGRARYLGVAGCEALQLVSRKYVSPPLPCGLRHRARHACCLWPIFVGCLWAYLEGLPVQFSPCVVDLMHSHSKWMSPSLSMVTRPST